MCVCVCVCVCVCIYMCVYVYMYKDVYFFTYIIHYLQPLPSENSTNFGIEGPLPKYGSIQLQSVASAVLCTEFA